MATFSIFIKGGFHAPKVNNKGEALIYWKYVHDERTTLFSTTCFAQPSQLNWIKKGDKQLIERYEPILKSAPAYSGKNKNIRSLGALLEAIVQEVKSEGLEPTIERVKERNAKKNSSKGDIDFYVFAESVAKEMFDNSQIRRAVKYRCVTNKVKKLLKLKELPLVDLTRDLLLKYKSCAQSAQENKTSTINADLKVIRAILNNAHAKNKIRTMPLLKGLIVEKEPIGKKGLNFQQLNDLYNYQPPVNSYEFHSRNLWLFSFFNAGVRIGDLLQLTWRNIFDGRLEYIMAKTENNNRPVISFEIKGLAKQILGDYKGKCASDTNTVIFPLLRKEVRDLIVKYPVEERDGLSPKILEIILKDVSAKTTLINKSLKRISQEIGLENVKLTTHIARHTYSQVANKSGVSIEDLAKLLNHASPKTTKAYEGGNRNNHLDALHKAVTESIELNLKALRTEF